MFLVVNPGTHPAPRWLANGLASQGAVHYLTALGVVEGYGSRLLPRRVRAEWARRVLPPNLTRHNSSSGAPFTDLVYLAARRSGHRKAIDTWRERRNRAVNRRAIRFLRRNAGQVDGVVTTASACLDVAEYCVAHQIPLVSYLPQPYEKADVRYVEEVNLADGLLVASRYVAQSAAVGWGPERIVVSNLGVDSPAGLPAPEPRVRDAGTSFKLIFVGRADPNKGLKYLLEALSSLRDASRDVKLTVVSPDHLQLRGDLSLVSEVELVPAMSRTNLYRRFDQHDVLVVPSLREGFGLVVVEALSRGLPVIVTTTTGAADVGLDEVAGLAVAPADAKSLERAIARLYDDPVEVETFSRHAIKLAQRFSWPEYSVRTAELVTQLFGAIHAEGLSQTREV